MLKDMIETTTDKSLSEMFKEVTTKYGVIALDNKELIYQAMLYNVTKFCIHNLIGEEYEMYVIYKTFRDTYAARIIEGEILRNNEDSRLIDAVRYAGHLAEVTLAQIIDESNE